MKSKVVWLFITTVIGFALSYFITDFYKCGYSIFCHNLTTFGIALHFSMPALAFVFGILYFVPQAFDAWKKFAVWFVPLAALLFIFYPEPGAMDFLSPEPEVVYQWVSGLYLGVSAAIILAVSRKGQHK